jgi:hypothetical protein
MTLTAETRAEVSQSGKPSLPCPACNKPHKKHYPFCFGCFARLPMGIRYLLSSFNAQVRQHGYSAALVHLAETAQKRQERSGGNLF